MDTWIPFHVRQNQFVYIGPLLPKFKLEGIFHFVHAQQFQLLRTALFKHDGLCFVLPWMLKDSSGLKHLGNYACFDIALLSTLRQIIVKFLDTAFLLILLSITYIGVKESARSLI